jgi:hypothetical protein
VIKGGKNIIKLAVIVYFIFSVPPVFYVSHKVIKKISLYNKTNRDFVLENEIQSGGGGVDLPTAYS